MERAFVRNNQIRVLVLDNSAIHTQLLAEALRRDPAFDVLTLDSPHAVVKTAIERAIDVLVIGAHLEERTYRGLEILRELRVSRPDIRAVVLFDSYKTQVVVDAFRAGARGVFSGSESIDRLRKCIECVYAGQVWANSQEMSVALEALVSAPKVSAVDANGLNLLSPREKEIVHRLAEGMTNREIAQRLRLSQHTVKNYLFRVFDKLGVSNRVELLFMTMNQDSSSQSVFNSFLKSCSAGNLPSDSILTECQQAAEEGSPIAQLILSQFHWMRKTNGTDLVLAYKWCLIASAQISRTGKSISKNMSMEQLLYAEKMVADWLRKTQKAPPASVTNIADCPKRGALSAASD